MLLAPAALALGRERVWREAQAYAQAAVIDPVSGLFNRRYFQARLDEELQRAIRQLTSVGLLMVDLDGFKSINDRFGHVAGDLVIRDISEILRRSVRIFDVCTRFGGEEFAVMMPGGPLKAQERSPSAFVSESKPTRRSELDLADLRVTASIGVAVSPPGVTARDLIERADRALYHAKKAGKNRVSTASGDGTVLPALSHSLNQSATVSGRKPRISRLSPESADVQVPEKVGTLPSRALRYSVQAHA